MRLFSLILPIFFPFVTLAWQSYKGTHFHHRRQIARNFQKRANEYTLVDRYQGTNFFEGWDFFSGADPTHGKVNYLNQTDAFAKKLAFVQRDNTTVLAVDDKSAVPIGGNRNSVRISSKKAYNSGLFIADFKTMPHGCGVWPSWWSAGPNWPNAGEIDIIEGVNNQATNQYTLHSGPTGKSCILDRTIGASSTTSNVMGTKCLSSDGDNTGCAFSDTDPRSYGQGFNQNGGGVYAHIWDKNGIKMWHFARNEIPEDIAAGRPDPSSWPTPQAAWTSETCDITGNFYEHTLTLDTTICGDWAEGAYPNSGCPGSCAEAVADPKNFAQAKWKINYIAVYQ